MPASQGLLRNRSGTPALATASHTALSLARAAGAAALGKARGQRDGIDGAGAGGADPGDLERLVLEQTVEHAPGEGAVRAAALERQIEAPPSPPEISSKPQPPFAAAGRRTKAMHQRPQSWQHVERQHNRHALDLDMPRLDAVDGGKVLGGQHVARRAGCRHRCRPASARCCGRSARRATGRAAPPPPCGRRRQTREVAKERQLVRGIEAGRRLVGQQHARLLRQRPRHQHARALAARHLQHRPTLQVRHVHGGERCIDGLRVGGAFSRTQGLVGAAARAPPPGGALSAQCTRRSCGR